MAAILSSGEDELMGVLMPGSGGTPDPTRVLLDYDY